MAEIDINKLKSKYGYVVLSACRNEKTKKENAERTQELQKTLNAEGFLNEKDKTTFRFREVIHQLQHDNISSILPKI